MIFIWLIKVTILIDGYTKNKLFVILNMFCKSYFDQYQ